MAWGIYGGLLSVAAFGGFGLVSVSVTLLVLWQTLSNTDNKYKMLSLKQEKVYVRVIGGMLITFALVIFALTVKKLTVEEFLPVTFTGVIVSTVSLITMYLLWTMQKQIRIVILNNILTEYIDCSLTYMKLAMFLLAGSVLCIARADLWWIDGIVGMILAVVIYKKGLRVVFSTVNKKPEKSGCCSCKKGKSTTASGDGECTEAGAEY